ncbi:MAG: alpha/beta hydrolase [Pseudomonadota bacterium]|nr:alpha/beta hydrolase [Pseudomonadota bacterium]
MYFEVNGIKTFCSNGSGVLRTGQPSVIFIHGAGLDHTTFALPARYFARHHYNVYALDLPGHGRSAGSPLVSITEMATWTKDAMDQLEILHPAIVGYSMGSLVALQFAVSFPAQLRSLVLVGTSIPMPVSDPLLNAARDNHHDAIDMTNTWSHSRVAQLGGNENPGMNMLMNGQRLLESAQENLLFIDLKACNDFTGSSEVGKKIEVETLILVGQQDQMTAPVKAFEMANAIPNSRIQTLTPCGHAMLSEQPNAVLDALTTIV